MVHPQVWTCVMCEDTIFVDNFKNSHHNSHENKWNQFTFIYSVHSLTHTKRTNSLALTTMLSPALGQAHAKLILGTAQRLTTKS